MACCENVFTKRMAGRYLRRAVDDLHGQLAIRLHRNLEVTPYLCSLNRENSR
jgi:hypothetical protein